MTILNEYMQMPQNAKIGIVLFVVLAVIMLVLIIMSIICLRDNKKDAVTWSILVAAVFGITLFIVGIIDQQSQREHVIQAIFDDSYPITQVMNFYEVRNIDGKIYTLIEKAP